MNDKAIKGIIKSVEKKYAEREKKTVYNLKGIQRI